MTDEEIVDALVACNYESLEISFDIIKRKQAEIDSLREDLKRACAERDAHICTNNIIKSEAVKEFAARLVYTLCINNEKNTEVFDYAYTLETIDNLVKEMVGDGLGG